MGWMILLPWLPAHLACYLAGANLNAPLVAVMHGMHTVDPDLI
ncbi:hypothetical protein [Chloroflexus sp.]|nr:hypothetical protein [Chloroflexus sp.]MDW8403280.1 hypothetical protein [Chloroflexus sp.]